MRKISKLKERILQLEIDMWRLKHPPYVVGTKLSSCNINEDDGVTFIKYGPQQTSWTINNIIFM